MMTRDIWTGLVMLATALAYWLAADAIRISPLDGPVGASGLPKTLAYALGALAVLLIIRASLIGRRPSAPAAVEAEAAGAAAPDDMTDGGPTPVARHLKATGMLAIGVGYLLIVPWAGYAISVGLLLLAVGLYVGAAPGPRILAFAALGAGFFYLLFVRFLGIPLPSGAWPSVFGA